MSPRGVHNLRTTDDGYCEGDDGLICEVVGPWAKQKLKLVNDYSRICGGARQRFRNTRPAFIDLFCGPGRSKIRDSGEYIEGSPIVAFKSGIISAQAFSSIEISDLDPDLLSAAEERLKKISAPVLATKGPALEALDIILTRLNPNALHFVFLDPHNLGTLSFQIFEKLAKLKHVDILVHVSLSDLRRNAGRYTSEAYPQFDNFAPNWREGVSENQNHNSLRSALIGYWTEKLLALGLPRAKHSERIESTGGQQLYWLMLVSRHPLAHKFWEKVTSLAVAPQFDFGKD